MPPGELWTESPAAMTAAAATATPPSPRTTWERKTSPPDVLSLLARKALELPAAVGVELGHLPGEMPQRQLAVVRNELVHPRLRAQVRVLLARVHRPVEVGLALAPAAQHALLVQPAHDRHVGGVRTRGRGARVERLHHLAHRHLGRVRLPHAVHHLGLELVQRRWDLGSTCHVRRRVVDSPSAPNRDLRWCVVRVTVVIPPLPQRRYLMAHAARALGALALLAVGV